jgi:hypothetical protein
VLSKTSRWFFVTVNSCANKKTLTNIQEAEKSADFRHGKNHYRMSFDPLPSIPTAKERSWPCGHNPDSW